MLICKYNMGVSSMWCVTIPYKLAVYVYVGFSYPKEIRTLHKILLNFSSTWAAFESFFCFLFLRITTTIYFFVILKGVFCVFIDYAHVFKASVGVLYADVGSLSYRRICSLKTKTACHFLPSIWNHYIKSGLGNMMKKQKKILLWSDLCDHLLFLRDRHCFSVW